LAELREDSGTGERRRAREYALQLLFQLDISPEPTEEAIEAFWKGKKIRASIIEFATRLVRGAVERREWIDNLLAGASHHWRVARMGVVDRNILRLAIQEMLFERGTPPIVVINEAIEIAKKFATDESGPFINGILDSVRLRVESGDVRLDEAPGGSGGAGPTPEDRLLSRARA
jgi:N utilization substance protein B